MPANTCHYFMVAGEPSGDQHAAALIAALQQRQPAATFSGVAGPRMRQRGVQPLFEAEDLAVMGFSDVIKALPRLIRLFRRTQQAVLAQQPQAVILVDYPGFNLRLAKALRSSGYKSPIIQYISPSVWAWGVGRKATMASSLDALLTIYPFEKAHFADTSLRVEYVGNPLISTLKTASYNLDWRSTVGLPGDIPFLGLFPGSRRAEVERNLPSMLMAVSSLGYPCTISAANKGCLEAINALVPSSVRESSVYVVPRECAYFELMSECRAAIAKSGTVTLELALRRCPTVVTYQLTPLNRWIARYLLRLRLPYYCIVNILAGRAVFPEYIAEPADTATLVEAVQRLAKEGQSRQHCLAQCDEVIALLTDRCAATTAATVIEDILQATR